MSYIFSIFQENVLYIALCDLESPSVVILFIQASDTSYIYYVPLTAIVASIPVELPS